MSREREGGKDGENILTDRQRERGEWATDSDAFCETHTHTHTCEEALKKLPELAGKMHLHGAKEDHKEEKKGHA